ncbi:MAG: hypothetical protein HY961_08265 [Ignavibacteriae bacterium]|nr:hypothetical protein [Ignavibacteriota bacterium]
MKKKFYFIIVLLVLLGLYLIKLLVLDHQSRGDGETLVAEVNGAGITVTDFRMNYEFGWGRLKNLADPIERKRRYLSYMINEKLFATEGYRMGFNASERVRNLEAGLLNELLIEKLIDVDVKGRVSVSKQEVEEEINRSKVSFKFRFWAEYTKERAERVRDIMVKDGFLAALNSMNRANAEPQIDVAAHETGYLTHQDLSPEIFAALKEIPVGAIPEPALIEGKWFIFQMVDIRRSAVTSSEYLTRYSTFEKVLFHAKLRDSITAYVDSMLTPRKFTTKGKFVQLIAAGVAEWFAPNGETNEHATLPFAEAVDRSTQDQPALFALKGHLDDVALTYDGGELKLRELLRFLKVNELKPDMESVMRRERQINERIAISLRDEFLTREAAQRGYARDTHIQKTLTTWRDKWVCEEFMNSLVRDIKSGTARDENDAKAIPALMLAKARFLSEKNSITIYSNVLDTVRIDETEKSKLATFQIFRAGTNRPAFPVVDPVWTLQ